MRTQKIDQSTARAINRSIILNELRRSGPLTRARLAERTGLSAASMTIVTAELLDEGLLVERPELSEHLPRRPIPLDINYAGHYAIGLKLLEDGLEVALTDLSLRVIAHHSLPLERPTPGAVVEAAARALEQVAGQVKFEKERLVGVGLGMAGVIDEQSGVCLRSHRLGWSDVPIGRLLSERLGVPAWVDNDVNAFATAERLLGRAKQASHFLVVTVGRGVGSACVIHGRLYRGRNGAAGEAGHIITDPGGRLCECGHHGCLEAYASEPNLLAQWQDRCPGKAPPAGDALLALLQAQDPDFLEVLSGAGMRLGRVIATLVTAFNPELLIIGGEGVRLGEALLGPLHASFRANVFSESGHLPILVDDFGAESWTRGAAGLAVEQFFEVAIAAERVVTAATLINPAQ